MAESVMEEVGQVRELTDAAMVNLHLGDGWKLLLVRTGLEEGHNPETGEWEKVPTTVYVVGWSTNAMPKAREAYEEDLRQPSAYDEPDF